MKKIYMSLFSLAICSSSFAQSNLENIAPLRKDIGIDHQIKTGQHLQEKGATIWTNDFSAPADWTMTDNGSTPAADWVITTDVNAIPYSGLNPAGHTTAANGYALIDSDTPGDAAMQNVDITLATPVDLTGYPMVNLVFEHSYRIYGDVRTVQISVDGGATWTDYVITDGTGSGDTQNPDVMSINISSVAGNQASVLIRFHYEGAWGWFWAIDDLKITESDNHDLVLTSANFESLGLPYYMVPTSQVTAIDMYGVADNIGLNDQTNTVLSCSIDGIPFGTSAPVTVVSGAVSDTLVITSQYTPAATVGAHPIYYHLGSDSIDADTSNNSAAMSMEVTDYIYARDNGVVTGGSYNAGNAFEIGNWFDMFADETLYSINVGIHSAANPGAVVYGVVYSIDAATGDFLFEQNTDDYTVQASDLDAEITLTLFSPFNMTSGESYLIVIGAYGDGAATNDLVVSRAGASAAQTSFFYDGTDLTWYYTTNTPWVRMNSEDNTGIGESEMSFVLGQNQPNPFNNNTMINYTLNEASKVNFKVVDNTGKIVIEISEGTKTAGDHILNLNAETLANGIYHYTISTEKGSATKTMVVNK